MSKGSFDDSVVIVNRADISYSGAQLNALNGLITFDKNNARHTY